MTKSPLTSAEIHILLALDGGPQHGYGIKNEVEERTSGEVRLGPGTLYEAIQRMVRRGWIERAADEAELPEAERGPSRRYYELTTLGRERLAVELARLEGIVRYARSRNLLGDA